MWFSQNLTMKTSFSLFLLSSALALAACAPMGGSEGGPPPRDEGNTARAAAPGPVAQLQTQLQETADALKLTPKQAVLWDVYQEKVGALMADQMKQSAHSASQRQNAPQQIARKVEVVRNRLAAMEDIQETAGKLYAALDAEQRKVADAKLPQTVPALYSGFVGETTGRERRGEPPGSGRGGMGGGPGGGGGRM